MSNMGKLSLHCMATSEQTISINYFHFIFSVALSFGVKVGLLSEGQKLKGN